jgi:hypothetical protein
MQLQQRLTEIDLDAYFQRIGYSGDCSPRLTTLQAIHQRHFPRDRPEKKLYRKYCCLFVLFFSNACFMLYFPLVTETAVEKALLLFVCLSGLLVDFLDGYKLAPGNGRHWHY